MSPLSDDQEDVRYMQKLLREALSAPDDYFLPKRVDRQRYPHSCPRCGEPAYVGLSDVDCSAGCR